MENVYNIDNHPMHEGMVVKRIVRNVVSTQKRCMIKDLEMCIFTTYSTKLSYSKDHHFLHNVLLKGQ